MSWPTSWILWQHFFSNLALNKPQIRMFCKYATNSLIEGIKNKFVDLSGLEIYNVLCIYCTYLQYLRNSQELW